MVNLIEQSNFLIKKTRRKKVMCRMKNYPNLYLKAGGILREEGINPSTPGYEMLRRGIVIYKIEGPVPNFFEQVRNGMVVPSNEVKKQRRPEEQWMIEAMKSRNINVPLMDYIQTLAAKL